jgi:protein-L-isoaspartate(D-aspartate) O-methyltransferase
MAVVHTLAPRVEPATWNAARHALVDAIASSGAVRSPRVIDAMLRVPRHEFLPIDQAHLAYEDEPIPIGYDQTVPQPSIVAVMTEALSLDGHERVLEIGTGTGYQCALLCELAREVYSIERIRALSSCAQNALHRLGYRARLRVGDGALGWPDAAPFDAILLSAAPRALPIALLEQLADGGRFVAPIEADDGSQELVHVRREGNDYVRKRLGGVRLVPMVPGTRTSIPPPHA